MASVNYDAVVPWDVTLIDVGYTDTENGIVKGLVESATKITTGAPTATAKKFIPGAIIKNAVSGLVYINSGTTAAPVWTAMAALVPGAGTVLLSMLDTGIAPSHVVKFAGTASGGTTATRAYTITGALATDVATAVIRASTNAASIQKATLSTDTLTVLFSTDPGASTTVDYSVLRAAV